MALPDDTEKVLLEQFRRLVNDVISKDSHLNSDMYLIRWIRARNNNLENAECMLRASLKWRRDNNIDELLQEMPDPYFSQGFPYFLNGVDKMGQPVLCIAVGQWNPKKVVEDGKVEEFTKYTNRMYERISETIRVCDARRTSSNETTPITQFTLIMNFADFSVMHMASLQAIQSMLQFALIYEAHYPEILYRAFFINTNPVFQALFAMMKPLLAPRTLGKITCYGTSRGEWEPAIRAVIEEHQIPRQFGG